LSQADRNWQDEYGLPRGSGLYYACFYRLTASAQYLISKDADVNAQGGKYSNALIVAAEPGHCEIVKMLLDKGADVNAQGGLYCNALQAASAEGHDEIIKLLLDRGADVNAQGGLYSNALCAAYRRGDREIVKLLRGRGAAIPSSKRSNFRTLNNQAKNPRFVDSGPFG
jgi:ankyrin repeat protein